VFAFVNCAIVCQIHEMACILDRDQLNSFVNRATTLQFCIIFVTLDNTGLSLLITLTSRAVNIKQFASSSLLSCIALQYEQLIAPPYLMQISAYPAFSSLAQKDGNPTIWRFHR